MAWSTRFLTAVAFLAAGVIFAPEFFRSTEDSPAVAISIAKLAHLLCFATSFGAALWVTFIGGIIMFKLNITTTGANFAMMVMLFGK